MLLLYLAFLSLIQQPDKTQVSPKLHKDIFSFTSSDMTDVNRWIFLDSFVQVLRYLSPNQYKGGEGGHSIEKITLK